MGIWCYHVGNLHPCKDTTIHDMSDMQVIEDALKGKNQLEVYKIMLEWCAHGPEQWVTSEKLFQLLRSIYSNVNTTIGTNR